MFKQLMSPESVKLSQTLFINLYGETHTQLWLSELNWKLILQWHVELISSNPFLQTLQVKLSLQFIQFVTQGKHVVPFEKFPERQ